jgi:hypothetical protein
MAGRARVLAGLLAVVTPVTLDASGVERERPSLDLRASPRVAYPPVRVMVVAELKGGADAEEFYCPAVKWEWGDGSTSGVESDCDPFEPGTTLERRFTGRHAYREPGEFDVRVTLQRAGRDIASATIQLSIVGPDTVGVAEER